MNKPLLKRALVALAVSGLAASPILATSQAANAALVCATNFKLTPPNYCETVANAGSLSFTVPSGVTEIQAILMGAGGGGGAGGSHNNGASTSYYSGGGGGAGEITGMKVAVTPGNTVTFTGGVGGTKGIVAAPANGDVIGSNGADGGNSTVVVKNGATTVATFTARGGKGGQSGTNGGAGGADGDGIHLGGAGYNNIPGAVNTAGGGGGSSGGNGVAGRLNKGGDGGETVYEYPQTLIHSNTLFPYFSSNWAPANTYYQGQPETILGGWMGIGGGGAVAAPACTYNSTLGRGGQINMSTTRDYIGFAACQITPSGSSTGKLHNNGLYIAGEGGMAGVGSTSPNGDGLDGNYGFVWVRYAAVNLLAPTAPGAPIAAPDIASTGLSWTAPATGTNPFTYTVTSDPAGPSCTVTDLTAICTGLVYGTSYKFKVTATNDIGSATSAQSDPVLSVNPNADALPPQGDGNLVPISMPAGDGKTFTPTNDPTFQLGWDKTNGKLFSQATGIYTGYIEAKISFTANAVAYTCTAQFGVLKALPGKTAAQKAAAMVSKTFKGKQFCTDKTKLDPKTTSPKGGMTTANFKKIKSMNKSKAELAQEKAALAALKGFTGQVQIQVTRYRAWPTTMVNLGDFNSKGGKIPAAIRNTVVTLN